MGIFDGSSGSTTSGPPDWAVPTMQAYLGRAQEVSDLPYNPYTGQRFAGINAQQQQAMQATQNRAMQGNEVMNQASGSLAQTAGGGYLGAQAMANPYMGVTNPYAQGENPYLQQQIDAGAQDVTRNYNLAVRPQMDNMAARAGSFGNSGVQQMEMEQQRQLGQTLGNMSSGMRMQDYTQRAQLNENQANRMFQGGQSLANSQNQLYDAERGRQMQAAGMAPTFAANDYADADRLMNVGNVLQQNQQQGLDYQAQQWQDAQNYPRQQLQTLGNALGVNFGNTTTTTQGSPSLFSRGLGGALAGYSLGGGSGAGLGGLLGLLGG